MTTTRVLYIGGAGRSGSTVLASVLGEVPGLVAVGEVRFLWDRGVLQDRRCGCGVRFASCSFWQAVLRLAFGDVDQQALARRMQAELRARTRMRRMPGVLTRHRDGSEASADDELGPAHERLYAAIAEVAGAQVVVDSSKLPTYAALLGQQPGIDLHVLQLVRDPRASAYSWECSKPEPDLGPGGLMERRGPAKSAALWRIWNGALEKWCRDQSIDHRLQNYESFAADPVGEIRRILRRFDLVSVGDLEDVLQGIFAADDVVRLRPSHTVAGNPDRHRQGLVPVVPDERWRAGMTATDRRTVEALTWPALRHYGYVERA